MYIHLMQCLCAGSALGLRTVRQKEKKRSFVVLERRSIHKSCPRTENPVLNLRRIVIMQNGDNGEYKGMSSGKIGEKQHVGVHVYMYPPFTNSVVKVFILSEKGYRL